MAMQETVPEQLTPEQARGLLRELGEEVAPVPPALGWHNRHSPIAPNMAEKWNPRHDMAVQLQLAGMRYQQIAECLGYHPAYVGVILRDPRAYAIRARMAYRIADKLQDVQQRLQIGASEALDEIFDELRNSKDEKIRQRAGFGILDRAGYSKIERRISADVVVDEKIAARILGAAHETMGGDDFNYGVEVGTGSGADDVKTGTDD